MSEASKSSAPERCFDVSVSIRPEVPLEEVRQRAQASQTIPMEKLEALIKAFGSRTVVMLGHDVPRSKAEKAKQEFEAVGLKVDLKAALALEAIKERMTCPHCKAKVEVDEDRLCPSCGKNVDPNSPPPPPPPMERAASRPAAAPSPASAKDAAAPSAVPPPPAASPATAPASAGLSLVAEPAPASKPEAAAPATPRAPAERDAAREQPQDNDAQDKDRRSRDKPEAERSSSGKASSAKPTSRTHDAQQAAEADAAAGKSKSRRHRSKSGADLQALAAWRRPLLKLPAGVLLGGALALMLVGAGAGVGAAHWLGQRAQNKATSVRQGADLGAVLAFLDARHARLAGLAASGAAVADGEPSSTALLNLARQERAQGGTALMEQVLAKQPWGRAASQPEGAAVDEGPLPVLSVADRQQLAESFALRLAEMGQAERAKEVLATLAAAAQAGRGAPVAPAVEVLAQAWRMGQPGADATREQLQALRAKANTIPQPAEQVRALAGAAAALAQFGQMPSALLELLMEGAAQAANRLEDPAQRATAMQAWDWGVSDVLYAKVMHQAQTGDLAGARVLAEQFEVLRRQLPAGPSLAHHRGLQYRALVRLAQEPQAASVMTETLAHLPEQGSPAAQAEFLRELAAACEAVPPSLLQAAVNLSQQAAGAAPGERNQAFIALARLALLAGQPERASQWSQEAQTKLPPTGAERAKLQAQWLVYEQLDLAQQAQRAGRVGESEQRVRKVAAYLL